MHVCILLRGERITDSIDLSELVLAHKSEVKPCSVFKENKKKMCIMYIYSFLEKWTSVCLFRRKEASKQTSFCL